MTEITHDIVLAAGRGDQAASREIIEALHRPVIATIYRFLGPRFHRDAEDIAQDVFLKVFRALSRFDPAKAAFTTWVYSLVRNHCYDVLKKRRLPTSSLTPAEPGESQRDLPDRRELQPARSAQNVELGRKIADALSELGEDQRMVFILREYEGLDYDQIAEAVGVSKGTVKSRLFRAKETLRQRLDPYVRSGEP
ncbi:MAG: sigma-70 family RNA polymerase sigma factor [Planctomycetota bacterium]